jgi:aerobic carbon-monoxide dehydrogenase medium subunit
MKPAPFTYHAPENLDEALALLALHGDAARPLAGGQSLVPMMNMRVARPEHLIDLNGIANLSSLRETEDGVEIGALTRHRSVERSELLRRTCPILPCVVATIGHHAIRERGTVGGSLALADPAAQWPLLAVLLDARLELAGSDRRRSINAQQFFQGVFATALASDELVTAVRFPPLAPREGWGYRSFTRRHGDFAIVAVAATLELAPSGTIAQLRLALSGVCDTPVALGDLAKAQRGRAPDETWVREVAAAAASSFEPPGDLQASAAFRNELAGVLTEHALADALRRARE